MSRVIVLLLLAEAGAQRGSVYRCKNRNPECKDWASRGECSTNHDFMAESCPAACEICSNGGLEPTPAVFELDYVCRDRLGKNRLAIPPPDLRGTPGEEGAPSGCGFRCRDNMTGCAALAAAGRCETSAATMRAQCAETCGICKAYELPSLGRGGTYPRHACRADDGDLAAREHPEQCGRWAEAGECVTNYAWMSENCEASCGLCIAAAAGGEHPRPYEQALRSGRSKRAKPKKKAAEEEEEEEAAQEAGQAPPTLRRAVLNAQEAAEEAGAEVARAGSDESATPNAMRQAKRALDKAERLAKKAERAAEKAAAKATREAKRSAALAEKQAAKAAEKAEKVAKREAAKAAAAEAKAAKRKDEV